ncbi:DNA adenine methylase [Candidatus Symbiopectobacterium sp. NZEC135]|uniref:DNA adenine methylase n=1 Tax=Candidatus Symbiopectobacterium sp. NZEC135 TaxID=2820471 RepID=UPI0029CAAF1D|nr:DNA adenine methylase [Candidatus Symbiopectobacterium sp. NZEC135]
MSVNGTPLKWAGSKARIMDTLREHLPAGQRLVEPFAGSRILLGHAEHRLRRVFSGRYQPRPYQPVSSDL